MKKSTIKRRKRVVPASYNVTSDNDGKDLSPDAASTSPSPEANISRGTINLDGSINLGRPHELQRRTLLPEPINVNRGQHVLHADLTGYATQSNKPLLQHTYALAQQPQTDQNRLPPIAAFPPVSRSHSLSPNLHSASRKRSFSSTNHDLQGDYLNPDTTAKRLSSIKSLLNPSTPQLLAEGPAPTEATLLEQNSQDCLRPDQDTVTTPLCARELRSSGDSQIATDDQSKAERRHLLRREAEQMREALLAKERELAALEPSEK